MSLLTDLITFWKADEASGDAIDAQGASDLTDNNGVGSGTGLVYSTARDYDRSNSEEHTHSDNADLSAGDVDFAIGVWWKLRTDAVSNYGILSKGDWGSGGEYSLRWSTYQLMYEVCSGSGFTGYTLLVDNGIAYVPGAWYFTVIQHDSTGNEISICTNDGTVFTAPYSAGVWDGAGVFAIGNQRGTGRFFDGLIGPAFIYKRLLTGDEITQLYNGGAGLRYEDLGGGGGGTEYDESYSGSCTPSGALAKAASKALAGNSTGAGVLTKLAAKGCAGSSAGSGSCAKQVSKSLAGGSTPSGILTALKVALLSMSGAMTAAGSLAKSTLKSCAGASSGSGTCARQTQKSLAGNSAASGAVVKQSGKSLGGSTTPSGLLTSLKVALLAIGGAMVATGEMAKRAFKSLAGSTTPGGSLTNEGGSPETPTAGGRRFGVTGRGSGGFTAAGRDGARFGATGDDGDNST